MLPIGYTWPTSARKRQLSPDVFVAFAPERARQSFDAAAEGGFPPFVLEVVSPSSTDRDEQEKRQAYDALGVREYALFTPREGAPSGLTGYRRGARGDFEPWPADEQGRLWSATLGLFLVARGALLRAQTAEGELLLTPDEAAEEVARLRRELERYRSQGGA
ncbi:MAG: hypothetical protein AVDCRST_MAG88-4224 [uncultured Thermomicrobiales bacterium]|uniref:Putative restriction endonuclease domain-containing protein n=1 Tax=uncultured Thermomicrobiales bacterium TaxID=1645740 RepID=A0A6J4VS58_9BACT|nr:MAG: hypothetical protein AVDCRST_MAG88-4224 [uncultured Thermomicrobiales bacterium]